MRRLPIVLVVFCLTSCLQASPFSDIWRPPKDVPAQCLEPRFEVILFDVSQSMLKSGLFQQAQENAAEYVLDKAPECTLLIVGAFGVTADVRGGEFIVRPTKP